MTHEADITNYHMSLEDDPVEAAFVEAVSKMPRCRVNSDRVKSEREARFSVGRWSHRDKVEWSCGTCTFVNQPLFLSCEMCGQARPPVEDEAPGSDAVAAAAPSTGYQEAQEEEERLKQERIREIMALQQQVFNKIREGQAHDDEEDHLTDDNNNNDNLEDSFAWNDLEDTVGELPVPTGRFSGMVKAGKKGPMDSSHNTISTAASSFTQLSSVGQFSSQWLDSSSYHNDQSRQHVDISRLGSSRRLDDSSYHSAQPGGQQDQLSGSSFHSTRMHDASSNSRRPNSRGQNRTAGRGSPNRGSPTSGSPNRNAAIPDSEGPPNLRGSARESYLRGALHKNSPARNSSGRGAGAYNNRDHNNNNNNNQGAPLVDFTALKAAIDGVSYNTPDVSAAFAASENLVVAASNHSEASNYDLLGGNLSNHSLNGSQHLELETPATRARRGGFNSSMPELQPMQEQQRGAVSDFANQDEDEEEERPVVEPRRSIVGALAVQGSRFPEPREIIDDGLFQAAKDKLKGIRPQPGEMIDDGLSSAKDTLFKDDSFARRQSGNFEFPTGTPSHLHQRNPEEAETEEPGSLDRLGTRSSRKPPTSSVIPAAKKAALPPAHDPVFKRNLYADLKHGSSSKARAGSPKPKPEKAESKSGIFNRMLHRKKTPQK